MMNDPLGQIMEQASQALARMEYLAAEARCLEALSLARSREDWAYYQRILLPLQECRRQRRMIAAEGTVRLGTTGLDASAGDWLEALGPAGCLVVTHPHTAQTAADLLTKARTRQRAVEVLFVASPSSAERWTLRSFAGPEVTCEFPAPPADWRERWWQPGQFGTAEEGTAGRRPWHAQPTRTPADWVLDAAEALGDAALIQAETIEEPIHRLEALERCLEVVTDHEILHQRLSDAAHQRALAPSRGGQ